MESSTGRTPGGGREKPRLFGLDSFEDHEDDLQEDPGSQKPNKPKKKQGFLAKKDSNNLASKKDNHRTHDKLGHIQTDFLRPEQESAKAQDRPESSTEETAKTQNQLAGSLYIERRKSELQQELDQTPEASTDQAAVLADQAYLNQLESQLAADAVLDEALLDDTLQSTADFLDLDSSQVTNIDYQLDAGSETHTGLPASEVVTQRVETNDTGVPVRPGQDSANLPKPVNGSAGPPPTGPPGNGGGGRGWGGGAPGFNGFNSLPNFNFPTNTHKNVNSLKTTKKTESRSSWLAGGFLAGGLLGYVLGRSSGREKQRAISEPIESRLKQENARLNQAVNLREQRIRQIARRGGELNSSAPAAVLSKIEVAGKTIDKPQQVTSIPQKSLDMQQVAPATNQNKSLPDLERTRTPDMTEVQPAQKQPLIKEKIYKNLEQEPDQKLQSGADSNRQEVRGPEIFEDTIDHKKPDKQIQHSRPLDSSRTKKAINRTELFKLAERMKIGETDFKQMYQDSQINEKNLRHAVAEFHSGHKTEAIAKRYLAKEQRASKPERVHETYNRQPAAHTLGGFAGQTAYDAFSTTSASGKPTSKTSSLTGSGFSQIKAQVKTKTAQIAMIVPFAAGLVVLLLLLFF